MSIGKLSKTAIVLAVIGGLLLFSCFQAYFYSEDGLLRRATQAKDKTLANMHCNEVKFIGSENSPPGGVRVFTWRCLSKVDESADVSILIESDGYPRRYTDRLACDADILKSGYMCSEKDGEPEKTRTNGH